MNKNGPTFKKSSRKREFLSTEFIENISIDFLNIGLNAVDDSEKPDEDVAVIIKKALLRLPEIQREVIEKYYINGLSINEVAKELELKSDTANNVRLRAIDNFKKLIIEEKRKLGITADYNLCPMCENEDYDAINEYIHLKLDSQQWQTAGIQVGLLERFKLKVNQESLAEHIKYHLDLGDDMVNSTISSEDKKKKPKYAPATALVISLELKHRIENLSFPHGVTYTDAVRQALDLGVELLEIQLRDIKKMQKLQFDTVNFLNRVKNT